MHWMVFVPSDSLLKNKQGQKGSVLGKEAHQPDRDPYDCNLPCYYLPTKITLLPTWKLSPAPSGPAMGARMGALQKKGEIMNLKSILIKME